MLENTDLEYLFRFFSEQAVKLFTGLIVIIFNTFFNSSWLFFYYFNRQSF